MPDEEADRTPAEHGRWLLAHCLDYYRRENKVAWWERFRLAECDVADYYRESNALAGLEFVDRVGGTDRAHGLGSAELVPVLLQPGPAPEATGGLERAPALNRRRQLLPTLWLHARIGLRTL